jgi:hypothetical protein
MHYQLWGYKVEEKPYLRVREQNKFEYHWSTFDSKLLPRLLRAQLCFISQGVTKCA